ncbi:MAG: SGNH/GDSL hydrolase family protein [Anaerolineales bacterium]
MKATLRVLPVILLLACACAVSPRASNSPQPPTVEAASPAPITDTPSAPATAEKTISPPQAESALPPGPLSIVSLGDSLTQGDGDDSGVGGYPPRLQALVDGLRPGSKVENLGRSGWTSTDLINGLNGEPSQLDAAVAAKAHIATVWIGSNDLWYLYEYGPDPMTAEAEQADLQTYEANINIILGRLTRSGAKVFIALLDDQSKRPVVASPPNPAEPAFPATSADDRARMSRHVDAYNEIIRRKAAQYGAETVDFFHTDIFTNPATLYTDGNHPNTAGYEKIAQIWFAALQPYLK